MGLIRFCFKCFQTSLILFSFLRMFFNYLSGVQFDVRKLQLGDFLWVARERTVPTPGIEVLSVHLYFVKIK